MLSTESATSMLRIPSGRSLHEVAAFCGITSRAITRWASTTAIKSTKANHNAMVTLRAICEYLLCEALLDDDFDISV